MKKIILFFVSILFAVSAMGQLVGDGLTPLTAYCGTITSAQSWTNAYNTGIIYVGQTGNEDLTIGTGGILSIEAGVTVKFCTAASDLIITGTGSLTANGTSLNKITFTRDYPSINSWGHISFQSMGAAGSSSLQYCIIEYGRKDGGLNTLESVGGGLQTDFNNIIISKCTFRYNYAFFGGGIFVNANRNPSIDNCVFLGNTSREAGGAIYLYNGSAAVISSCIFDGNNANGTLANYYSGGAIQFGQIITDAKVINCTFVNNTSAHSGNSVYTLSGGSVLNSVFWGSSNQIEFYSASGTVDHSAIQGYIPGSHYTNCFELNSSNTGTTQLPGPYFTQTDGTNWSIQFISPCRDAGTSSGAPSTDYLGNGRVGPYDIGAYEVQYNRWKTTASSANWTDAANWDGGVPSSSTSDVIIPNVSSTSTFYPTTNPQDFTIGAGKMLIVEPGAQLTQGTLTNTSGTLRLLSDANGIASLNMNSYIENGGTNEIQLYLDGNNSGKMWHYISPPVSSINRAVINGAGASVSAYEENLIQNDMNNGWVTSTGYHYNSTTGLWESTGASWLYMLPGTGYNYYASSPKTFTIQGTINTGDVSKNLAYNSGNFTPATPDQQGYNLIGNPFTCGLDWDAVIAANAGIWGNVESTIYFRLNGVTIYYAGGFTVPDTYNADASLVPPMQGFFIKSNLNNVTLNIPVSAKAHTTNKRYKGNSSSPNIRLQFENAANFDQTVVSFNEKATLSFDNLFDGRKLFTSDSDPYIYSVINGTNYAINGIPFPENSITIPLVINASTNGSYTIKTTEITGLENYKIYLNDKVQNNMVNLSEVSSYSFNASIGKITDRFTITITNVLTAVPENTVNNSNKPFNIYSSGGQINIQTLSDDWNGRHCEIKVHDLTGKVISQVTNVEFSKDEIRHVPTNVEKGIYIVEINSTISRYVGKVVIR